MKKLGILFLFCLPAGAHAQQPGTSTSPRVLETVTRASSTTLDNVGPTSPDRVLPGEPARRKNYLLPAIEIPSFQLALSGYDRLFSGSPDYGSTLKTGWRHVVSGHWVVDQDEFSMNQFGHTYSGSIYYGFARSAGLNFWEGWAYSNVGSFLWETYGEVTDPSINDQVASGTGGPLIGESLFRMSNLLLEGGGGRPGFWRELGAGILSPTAAINRLLFGERYAPVLKSRNAATFMQVYAGRGSNTSIRHPRSAGVIGHNVANVGFALAYGLPGRPGYLYLRPFDYFTFELNTLRGHNTDFANFTTRGLLFGKKYESGDSYEGIWGLYGSYDYFSPQIFRFSTTAASLGTTFQWWPRRKIALQGTASGGVGYGTAGTIVPQDDERDFHYGVAPQGLLALRLILGKFAMVDTTVRGFYLSGAGAGRAPGSETIGSLNSSFFIRIYGNHAIGVYSMISNRQAHYSGTLLPDRNQQVETVGVTYNLLGDAHFGAVNWERN